MAGNRRWGPQDSSCDEGERGVEAVSSWDSPDLPTGICFSVIHETDISVLIVPRKISPETLTTA